MKTEIVAAALLFALPGLSQSVIYAGTGFGTYYYDLEATEACDYDFQPIDAANVECSYYTGLSLDDIGSSYLVAMNTTQLNQDMSLYCGKQVNVYVNGELSPYQFFVGDGCLRCALGGDTNYNWNSYGAPGLDFSYTALSQLSSDACADGYIDITWEIVDTVVYPFSDTRQLEIPTIEVCNGDGP